MRIVLTGTIPAFSGDDSPAASQKRGSPTTRSPGAGGDAPGRKGHCCRRRKPCRRRRGYWSATAAGFGRQLRRSEATSLRSRLMFC